MNCSSHISVYFAKLPFALVWGIGLFLAFPMAALSQNDPLAGQDTLILENDRIEDVIDSEKPVLTPPSPQIQAPSVGDFQYNSKEEEIETDYKPRPPQVKPLEAPGRPRLYHNMLKLQFGRYLTPHASLYLNNGVDRNKDLGLQFTHESAHNDEITYRKYREDYGTVYGSVLSNGNKYHGKLHIYNTEYFNFVDPVAVGLEDFPENQKSLIEDSIRMAFTRIDLKGGIQSIRNQEKTYYYDLQGRLRYYNGRRENSELHLTVAPSGGVEITENIVFHTDLEFTYTRADIGSLLQDRTFFTITPTINFSQGGFKGKVGIVFNAYNNDTDSASISNLGPIGELSYALFPELTLFAGVSSGMQYNHYYDMIYANRYLARQIDIAPTTEKIQVYGGIKGKLGTSIDYSARAYFKQLENALVFTVPFDQAYFEATYDSLVDVIGISGEIQYKLTDELRLGGNITYENYSMSQLEKYFHATPLRVEAFARYTWQERLIAQANLGFYSSTPMGVDANGAIFNRDVLPIVNIHSQFKVSDRFYVHLNIDNLLNLNYQRWLFYPERNFDIKGGFSVIF